MTTRDIDEITAMLVEMSDALHAHEREMTGRCFYCGSEIGLDHNPGCVMHTAETVRIEFK